jgi:hypothetical protein
VRHHRVDISRAYQKSESRLAESLKILARFIIGLGKKGYLEASVLKHTAYYSCAKGGVVYVRVAANVNEIRLIPAARLHIGSRYGKKFACILHLCIPF